MIFRIIRSVCKPIQVQYISALFLAVLTFQSSLASAETLLTVVDMQPRFTTSQSEGLIENVTAAIKKAIEKKQPILFLEYSSMGPTDSRLTDLVKGYDKTYFSTKYTDDGSAEVQSVSKQYDLKPSKVKVCGVNTNFCVLATVEGIIDSMKEVEKITVLSNACGSFTAQAHQDGLDAMRLLSRTVIK